MKLGRINDMLAAHANKYSGIVQRGLSYREVYDRLLEDLEKATPDATSVTLDDLSLNLGFSGNRQDVTNVFKVLRKHGFVIPDPRPGEHEPEWCGYFMHEDEAKCRIWVSFSSTVCRRVQVGTQTQEVPIYDIVCDDPAST